MLYVEENSKNLINGFFDADRKAVLGMQGKPTIPFNKKLKVEYYKYIDIFKSTRYNIKVNN